MLLLSWQRGKTECPHNSYHMINSGHYEYALTMRHENGVSLKRCLRNWAASVIICTRFSCSSVQDMDEKKNSLSNINARNLVCHFLNWCIMVLPHFELKICFWRDVLIQT